MQINLVQEVASIFDILKESDDHESDQNIFDFFICDFVQLLKANKISSNFTVIKKVKVKALVNNIERSFEASPEQEEFLLKVREELQTLVGKNEQVMDELIVWSIVRQVCEYVAHNECDCEFTYVCRYNDLIKDEFKNRPAKKAKEKEDSVPNQDKKQYFTPAAEA